MPEIGIGRDYPVCPEGPNIFQLKEVEAKDMPNFDGSGTSQRLIWKFISRKRDPKSGEFYEIAIFTPPNYSGRPQSTLYWLMGRIDKRINKDWVKANGLHTDHYVGREYEGIVEHKLSRDGSTTYATFVSLKPVGVAPGALPAPPADAPGPDPFADEANVESCSACGKALAPQEEVACIKRWKGDQYFCAEHGRAAIEREKAKAEDMFAGIGA